MNDHDAKPLYDQFDAEAGPEFLWEFLACNPGAFRVLVGKAESMVDDGADKQLEAPFCGYRPGIGLVFRE
ncbi:hypothetical protein ACFQL4_06850 [Halosimplex aquaticum]